MTTFEIVAVDPDAPGVIVVLVVWNFVAIVESVVWNVEATVESVVWSVVISVVVVVVGDSNGRLFTT